MKIICLQKNLQKGLNITERVVGKNTSLPILNNVLLETQKGFLRIASTNLEIGINCWIPVKIEKEGSITIPVKTFSGFVNNLPNEKIFLETKGLVLGIRSSDYKANINGEESKGFPIIPKISGETLFNLKTELFKKSLDQVINSASLIENRPEINGILVKVIPGKILIIATDSFRLSEKTIDLGKGSVKLNKEISFIIPLRSAQELLRILNERSGSVEAVLGKNQILFNIESDNIEEPRVEFISRLIEGNFPDYKQLISKNFKTKVVLNKVDLLNAVKVSSVFSSKINDVKFNISAKNNTLEILAKDFDLGQNISKIKAEVTGEDLEVTFNYKYVIDGLNSVVADKVFFGFNESTQPALLKVFNSNDYIYIVMPIRNQ